MAIYIKTPGKKAFACLEKSAAEIEEQDLKAESFVKVYRAIKIQ